MLNDIIGQFRVNGAFTGAERYGSGLINETWLCGFSVPEGVRRCILQRINRSVFARPDLVMENVDVVTNHVQERLRQEGVADPASVAPMLVPTRDGRTWHLDGSGDVWRMFHFIENGEVFDVVQGPSHAFQVGRALGRFQLLLSDLPPEKLHDTLPGFHHTPRYLQELREAVGNDEAGRAAAARREIDLAESRSGYAPLLLDAGNSGRAPLRVVHNDPKVNNVLVHRETGAALCMLDLDTVKPGIVLFDFGDCVRSAANRAGEDAGDLDAVVFDRSCYEAILKGYLGEASAFLTPPERDLLPVSVRVITYELGVRFLADHLRGDTYFRIRYPGHNLLRARVQFRLLERMEQAGV
jgi:Ser/Thr protein kinase RdoA (MazF antagonist)